MKRRQNAEKAKLPEDNPQSNVVASTPLNRHSLRVKAQHVVPVQLSPVLNTPKTKGHLRKSQAKSVNNSPPRADAIPASGEPVRMLKVILKNVSEKYESHNSSKNKSMEMVIDDSDEEQEVVAAPKPTKKEIGKKELGHTNNSKISSQKNQEVPSKPAAPVVNTVESRRPAEKRPMFEFSIPSPDKRPRIFVPEDQEPFDFLADNPPPKSHISTNLFGLPKSVSSLHQRKTESKLEQKPESKSKNNSEARQSAETHSPGSLVIDDATLPKPTRTKEPVKTAEVKNKLQPQKGKMKMVDTKINAETTKKSSPKTKAKSKAQGKKVEKLGDSLPLDDEISNQNVAKHSPQKDGKVEDENKAPEDTESKALKPVQYSPRRSQKNNIMSSTSVQSERKQTHIPKKSPVVDKIKRNTLKDKTISSDSGEKNERVKPARILRTRVKKMIDMVIEEEHENHNEKTLPSPKSKANHKPQVASSELKAVPKEFMPTENESVAKDKQVKNQTAPASRQLANTAPEELGVRRSQRPRIKPVEYWIGERVQTKENEEGVLEIVHVEPAHKQKPSARKATRAKTKKEPYTVGTILRKLANQVDAISEDNEFLPDVELPTLVHMKLPLNAAKPTIMTDIEVASEVRYLEAASKNEGTAKKDNRVRFSTTLQSPIVSCGYIRIDEGTSKGLQVANHITVFSLLTSSKLEVDINGEKIKIGFGQHFWIPPGIAYDVKNLSKSPALLQYCLFHIAEASQIFNQK